MHNTALELVYEDEVYEGISEGHKQSRLEIAKEMLLKEMSISLISDITKLSQEEIEQLKNTKES